MSTLTRAAPVRRAEVEGLSMGPTLLPGDRLILFSWTRPRLGDIVAVTDPRRPDRLMVKRLALVTGDGYVVLGDNAGASTDSRSFGPVPRAAIRGRAVYRYAPASRAGPLARGWRRRR